MRKPQSLFFLHGKISKKSTIIFRVRFGRQECYEMKNPPTPNSPKQRREQSIFQRACRIINREMASPSRRAYWQQIADNSQIDKYTARKAAFAHYRSILQKNTNIAKYTHQKPTKHKNIKPLQNLNTKQQPYTNSINKTIFVQSVIFSIIYSHYKSKNTTFASQY